MAKPGIMSKPTFRFEVNLKKKKAPPPEPKEENLVDDARKWEMDVEKRLREIPTAKLREADWEDPITAKELLAAYNASLQRGQRVELGERIEATIEYSVFIDEWENKHVVTQPIGAKGQRISELVVSMDGNVLRLSLERVTGPILNLDCYLGVGLTEFNDNELRKTPGYWLQLTRYHRSDGHLVRVEQVRKHFDPDSNQIVTDQELTLS